MPLQWLVIKTCEKIAYKGKKCALVTQIYKKLIKWVALLEGDFIYVYVFCVSIYIHSFVLPWKYVLFVFQSDLYKRVRIYIRTYKYYNHSMS